MQALLKIKDKRGNTINLSPNPAQLYYESLRRRRNLILKARQKGITTWIDGDQLIDCIQKPTNAVVISHEREATQRLFRRVRFFIDHMPVKPLIEIENKSEISFPRRNSFYYIGTAGQRAFSRGDTVDRAHLSEIAFYLDMNTILNGISEAAEYGEINCETTANGSGDFKDLWEKTKAGKTAWTPIFIPWFIDNEYSVDNMTEKDILGLSDAIQEMFSIPEKDFELTPEEKEFIFAVKKHWDINISIGQIKWRRYKIADRGQWFQQEYPEDDVSCFLQSGRPVFRDITVRESMRKSLQKGVRYYGGLDCAEGIHGGDRHCFSVIDARNIEADPGKGIEEVRPHVAFQLLSDEPIEIFDQRVANVCKEYDIMLGVEKQGVGVAHVNKLRELGVVFQEWNTTAANRPLMITDLEEAYRKELLIETYKDAEEEAKNMFYDSNNRPSHSSDRHDDTVFARAIAWQMRKMPVPRVSII